MYVSVVCECVVCVCVSGVCVYINMITISILRTTQGDPTISTSSHTIIIGNFVQLILIIIMYLFPQLHAKFCYYDCGNSLHCDNYYYYTSILYILH